MNDKRYKYILYVIVSVIIATIGLQGYWNYKNYMSNKQQLITDIQTSLDKVVDDYYTQLAHQSTLDISLNGNKNNTLKDKMFVRHISKSTDKNNILLQGLDSVNLNSLEGITVIKGVKTDSILMTIKDHNLPIWHLDSIKRQKKLNISSSLKEDIKSLTSKVFISIKNDTLNIKKIDSLLILNLDSKKINLNYQIHYNKPKDVLSDFFKTDEKRKKKELDSIINPKLLTVSSKSTFLPQGGTLSVTFENANWAAFKKGISAILISTLLILAVIVCLFFLLKIIKDQKQLAEVKNDLLNNITHEFKTPIATIGAALEGINSFNIIENKEKTKEYINMSSSQLSKLNIMVEKILETATLDSESLKFNKEQLDVSNLLDVLVHRYKTQHQNKTFNLNIENKKTIINADAFHFENALSNILDNAVKYGGNIILVNLKKLKNGIEINISDNGNTLKKHNKDSIFEKFYRVPKGNTHDVKGFGIGLYYTKTIINNHDGNVALNLKNNLTTFKIFVPND